MPRRGALLFPLLVLLAGASLVREAAVGLFVPAEESWQAVLAKHFSPVNAVPPLTLVEINDETVLKHLWPWNAEDYALFFHAALPFEPRGIGVVPVLDFTGQEERENGEIFEKMLHDGVLRAPKLVLGATLGWSPDPEAVQEFQPMPALHRVRGDVSRLAEFTAVGTWAAEKFRLSTQPGWLNLPDAPGALGLCPLVLSYRGQPVPAMPLQLIAHSQKITLDDIEVVLGSHITAGTLRIPIDALGRMIVNPGVRFDRVPFDELIVSREQIEKREKPLHAPELFRARTVLLARTDTVSRSVTLPGGQRMSEGEFVAAAVATMQSGAHPRRIGVWFDWMLIVLTAAPTFWLPKWKATRTALTVLALEAAYVGAAVALHKYHLIVLPGALPFGLALWVLLLRVVVKKFLRVIAF